MWRSAALAIGICLLLTGAQCLIIEKVQLVIDSPVSADVAASPLAAMQSPSRRPEIIAVPEWAPWSFLSIGAVVLLYSATIPPKQG